MARIDHYHNPDAPRPNSLVPAATAVVADHDGRVLLQRRADNDLWALPGGTMDPGETIVGTVEREVLEETGLTVEVTKLVGVYSDPDHIIEYSDGEVRQQFALCFATRVLGGSLRPSSESTDLRWVGRADLDSLPMHPSIRLRIDHHFENRAEPYLG